MTAPKSPDQLADALTDVAFQASGTALRAALAELADGCWALAQAKDVEVARTVLARAHEVIRTAAEAGDLAAAGVVAEVIASLSPTGSGTPGEAMPAPAPLVLVIDDDQDTRYLVARRLSSAGYRVAIAADGGEGINLARRERPALVISDLQMPLAPGELVILALRTDPATAGIPILVLSGDLERLGPEHAVDAALAKPFAAPELLAVVRRLVGQPVGRPET